MAIFCLQNANTHEIRTWMCELSVSVIFMVHLPMYALWKKSSIFSILRKEYTYVSSWCWVEPNESNGTKANFIFERMEFYGIIEMDETSKSVDCDLFMCSISNFIGNLTAENE